jgi:hypothetical protein
LFVCAAVSLMGVPANAADANCQLKPGVWSWFVNGDVTFKSDGTAMQVLLKPAHRADGSLAQGKNPAKWKCANGVVTIVWSIGFTDKLVLSPSGKKLAGSNQADAAVSGRWKRDLP